MTSSRATVANCIAPRGEYQKVDMEPRVSVVGNADQDLQLLVIF